MSEGEDSTTVENANETKYKLHIEALQNEISCLSNRISDLQKNNTELQNSNTQLQLNSAELQKSHTELQKSNAELQESNSKVTVQCDEINSTYEELRSLTDEVKSNFEKIRAECSIVSDFPPLVGLYSRRFKVANFIRFLLIINSSLLFCYTSFACSFKKENSESLGQEKRIRKMFQYPTKKLKHRTPLYMTILICYINLIG